MTAALPFKPNWREPVIETLAYKTEIIGSRSGKEQRRAWRVSPRRTFEFSLTLNPTRYAQFKTFYMARRREEIALPDPIRSVKLTTNLNAGSTSFSVAETRSWLFAGAQICFLTQGRAELREVFSVVGTAVVLSAPVAGAWSSGSQIRPALMGRFTDPSGRTPTRTIFDGSFRFEVTPTSEVDQTPPAAPDTIGGVELLTARANWVDLPDVSFVQPRETVDYGQGQISTGFPIDFMTRTFRANYMGKSFAEAQLLKNVFMRAKGRRGEFLASTMEPDVVLMSTTAAGGATLAVAGRDFYDAYADSPVHKVLTFIGPDGTMATRAINSVTLVGNNSRITLAAGLLFDVTPSTLISWLFVSRFASDEMTLTWHTDTVADINWTIMSLETP